MMTEAMDPDIQATNGVFLRAEQITKVFPGTVALNGVNFNVYRGKVNGLVGENGAGKSTLMKIIAGIEQPTEGRILLEGEETLIRSPREAAENGIGIIHQELNLFPNLNVAENIFMACEITSHVIAVDHKTQEKRTREILHQLEQSIDPKALVSDLRIGQQQIVEIAKALIQDIRILIMDEPTSALSSAEVEVLFRIIGELKAKGVAIIYISHRLEEILQIGDYVTVLRDGKLIAEAPTESIDVSWIVDQMIGRGAAKLFHADDHDVGGELVRVELLTLPRPGGGFSLDHVSFSLRAGEILGVYGLMGAGRTMLLECLAGLHPEAQGEIWLEGQNIQPHSIRKRIRLGLSLIPEDRQREGLVQNLSISDNMTLASLWNYVKGFHLVKKKEDTSVARLVRELSIKVSSPQLNVSSLSGGNQQKVVVGKALLASPKVLLMDEPTRGIDVAAKADLFQIMSELASRGLGIIFVASELKEILGMTDRVLVMSRGQITGKFQRSKATEEALVAASTLGHEPAGGGIQHRGA